MTFFRATNRKLSPVHSSVLDFFFFADYGMNEIDSSYAENEDLLEDTLWR